jgi:cyclophilin family peptidyl-prolyl cis-trans isomerase
MHSDYGLPPAYTIFGKLTSGLEVLDAIATTQTGSQDRPSTNQTITSITITEA